MEKHLILDLKELHLIGIECDRCKTQTVVDISQEDVKVPVECASCGQFFYPGMEGGESPFQRLAKALRAARLPGHRLTAHVVGAPIEL
jgi:Zn ribbon nucleic-acid-binding protein